MNTTYQAIVLAIIGLYVPCSGYIRPGRNKKKIWHNNKIHGLRLSAKLLTIRFFADLVALLLTCLRGCSRVCAWLA